MYHFLYILACIWRVWVSFIIFRWFNTLHSNKTLYHRTVCRDKIVYKVIKIIKDAAVSKCIHLVICAHRTPHVLYVLRSLNNYISLQAKASAGVRQSLSTSWRWIFKSSILKGDISEDAMFWNPRPHRANYKDQHKHFTGFRKDAWWEWSSSSDVYLH